MNVKIQTILKLLNSQLFNFFKLFGEVYMLERIYYTKYLYIFMFQNFIQNFYFK